MSREVDRLGALVSELSLEPEFSMNEFSSRFRLQKYVYMAEVFGVDLGYKFSWYIHGPYSPDLTRVAFELFQMPKSERPTLSLKEWAKDKVRKAKQFVERTKPHDVDELVWLEALSFVHYLGKLGLKRSEIVGRMEREKPHISPEVVEKALGEISSLKQNED